MDRAVQKVEYFFFFSKEWGNSIRIAPSCDGARAPKVVGPSWDRLTAFPRRPRGGPFGWFGGPIESRAGWRRRRGHVS